MRWVRFRDFVLVWTSPRHNYLSKKNYDVKRYPFIDFLFFLQCPTPRTIRLPVKSLQKRTQRMWVSCPDHFVFFVTHDEIYHFRVLKRHFQTNFSEPLPALSWTRGQTLTPSSTDLTLIDRSCTAGRCSNKIEGIFPKRPIVNVTYGYQLRTVLSMVYDISLLYIFAYLTRNTYSQ